MNLDNSLPSQVDIPRIDLARVTPRLPSLGSSIEIDRGVIDCCAAPDRKSGICVNLSLVRCKLDVEPTT